MNIEEYAKYKKDVITITINTFMKNNHQVDLIKDITTGNEELVIDGKTLLLINDDMQSIIVKETCYERE